ncbi:uncharacterized protein LOC127798374 isoform X2 [Diospyros lotus]|uniref:uncharacterized protein LOC127798374 isoform X2 n=1 Tax=Diospyros lotus TaxID=55363 RepID=UPI002251456F|nr:uncharacterized protein LOC127798374 isoform X2 [Diospyros lotus]
MMSSGINLVMTVIGFAVSTMFIVFVCTRLICARIQLNASRRSFPVSSRSDLSIRERGVNGLEPVVIANFPTKKYSDACFSSSEDVHYFRARQQMPGANVTGWDLGVLWVPKDMALGSRSYAKLCLLTSLLHSHRNSRIRGGSQVGYILYNIKLLSPYSDFRAVESTLSDVFFLKFTLEIVETQLIVFCFAAPSQRNF